METIGRPLRLGASALLVALTLGAGTLAGCGGDSSDDSNQGPGYATKPADTGTTGGDEGGNGGGEMTPDADKPASAGDKKGDAPDDVISDRPGGSGSAPTSP